MESNPKLNLTSSLKGSNIDWNGVDEDTHNEIRDAMHTAALDVLKRRGLLTDHANAAFESEHPSGVVMPAEA